MSRRDTILVSRTLYQIGVMTVIGSIFWVLISVYLAMVKTPDLNVSPTVLAPINPVINPAVVASLSARLTIQQVLPQNASISGDTVNGVK